VGWCHLACTGTLWPLDPSVGGRVGLGKGFLMCHTTLAVELLLHRQFQDNVDRGQDREVFRALSREEASKYKGPSAWSRHSRQGHTQPPR
jgi:hypothetical protein